MKDMFDTIIDSALNLEPKVKTYRFPDGGVVKVGKINGVWHYQFPETGMKPERLTIEMRAKLRAVGINIV